MLHLGGQNLVQCGLVVVLEGVTVAYRLSQPNPQPTYV
jgi:hypothetical protein